MKTFAHLIVHCRG